MNRALSVYSINYDFVGPDVEGPKVLYVTLRDPPPHSLELGTPVRLESVNSHLVTPYEIFKVSAIVGPRVILSPYIVRGSQPRGATDRNPQWTPLSYGGHWGVTTRDYKAVVDIDRNWNYGNGAPLGRLVY